MSYSAKRSPYDNACIESFHAIFKKEFVYHNTLIDYNHAKLALFQYIEVFYNRNLSLSPSGDKKVAFMNGVSRVADFNKKPKFSYKVLT
ncbi:MAG: transposase [Clostridiales bacterium]|nr:transposase [Clostridiales bacterium]